MPEPRSMGKSGKTGAKAARVVVKIDYVKLRQLINEGKNAEDIRKAFDLKSKIPLRTAVIKLSMMDKKLYELEGLFGRGISNEVKYSKLGIRIPDSTIKGSFTQGDRFRIELKEGEIVLKKV